MMRYFAFCARSRLEKALYCKNYAHPSVGKNILRTQMHPVCGRKFQKTNLSLKKCRISSLKCIVT